MTRALALSWCAGLEAPDMDDTARGPQGCDGRGGAGAYRTPACTCSAVKATRHAAPGRIPVLMRRDDDADVRGLIHAMRDEGTRSSAMLSGARPNLRLPDTEARARTRGIAPCANRVRARRDRWRHPTRRITLERSQLNLEDNALNRFKMSFGMTSLVLSRSFARRSKISEAAGCPPGQGGQEIGLTCRQAAGSSCAGCCCSRHRRFEQR